MGRSTVLLVEDEPAVRELLADVLRDDGYDVLEAESGVAAVRALDEHGPPAGDLSLVVMDMMLPGMDGLDVLDHLGVPVARLPVVAMSASRTLLRAAVAAGARAGLYKPFDLNELRAVVSAYCPPRDQAAATSLASLPA